MNSKSVLANAADSKAEGTKTSEGIASAQSSVALASEALAKARVMQQLQQHEAATSASNRYLEELHYQKGQQQQQQQQAALVLQQEQEQAANKQAMLLRLMGGAQGPSSAAAADSEYLQKLQLEGLLKQQRQTTNRLEMLSTKDIISQNKYNRQESALQEAIRMARAKEQQHQQEQQQAAILQLLSFNGDNNNNNNAFLNGLLAANSPPVNDQASIARLLEEQERQRLFLQQQNQQSLLPSGVHAGSIQLELEKQLQQQIHAASQAPQGQEARADLIASMFSKAAAANGRNHDQQQANVLSAIARAEEHEKQRISRLQLEHQMRQESLQSTGMIPQQSLLHQPSADLQRLEQERHRQHQKTVEQDAAFHDSKSTILPCRARGMPMDHNVKTAYFVIPPDIKHGNELLCSYFACRNAGVKFRYCSYCKLPVAKRNFQKRHRHAGKIPEDQISKDIMTCRVVPKKKLDQEKQKEQQSEEETPSKPVKEEPKSSKIDPSSCAESPLCSATDCEANSSKVIENLDETEKVTVSVRGPSPSNSSWDQAIDTDKRREAWNALLPKRPPNEDVKSAAMVAWMEQVLRTSDPNTVFEGVNSIGRTSVNSASTDSTPNGGKKQKKSKFKTLFQRKEKEEMEIKRSSDDSNCVSSQGESDTELHSDKNGRQEGKTELKRSSEESNGGNNQGKSDEKLQNDKYDQGEKEKDNTSISSEELEDSRPQKKLRA